jgi:hypothetical protein
MGSRGSFPWLKHWSEFEYRKGKKFSLHGVENGSGVTQAPTQWVPEFFSGLMRPGREADHSPPINVEFKKTWIYTSTPP